MTAIRKEVLNYIESIDDSKLKALMPLLEVLVGDGFVIETDLTPEEHAIMDDCAKRYKDSDYLPFVP